jgi:hypothetical protein
MPIVTVSLNFGEYQDSQDVEYAEGVIVKSSRALKDVLDNPLTKKPSVNALFETAVKSKNGGPEASATVTIAGYSLHFNQERLIKMFKG